MSTEHPIQTLQEYETLYSTAWRDDSLRLARAGYYQHATDMVDPKAEQVIVDIGTGIGLLLMSICARSPKSLMIGTDRTQQNMQTLMQTLNELGFQQSIAVLGDAEWSVVQSQVRQRLQQEQVARHAALMRQLMHDRVLFVNDDILDPVYLPTILGDTPIDAGVLSLPGGSASRAFEWPFTQEQIEGTERNTRLHNITAHTRRAFYDFMSKHVRPGGRVVASERVDLGPKHTATDVMAVNTRWFMGKNEQYWTPSGLVFADFPYTGAQVPLGAEGEEILPTTGAESADRKQTIVIMRYERNNVPFKTQKS